MVIRTWISLFSGAGGLDLGLRIAIPDARPICYVEREITAAGILAARMEEGTLPEAPIWSDIRAFDGRPWRGEVDLIAGGFPCQDLSGAGKRAGITGGRSGLWWEFARLIGEIRPEFVFVENVPGLLANEAMRRVLGDLSALGFNAEWISLRASDVGAPHRRERVFLLAYAPVLGLGQGEPTPAQGTARPDAIPSRLPVADSSSGLLSKPGRKSQVRDGTRSAGEKLGDSSCELLDRAERIRTAGRPESTDSGLFPPGPGELDRWRELLVRDPWLRPAISQAEAESYLRDRSDGLADLVVHYRADALRAAGNGVVPIQAAVAFKLLAELMEVARWPSE